MKLGYFTLDDNSPLYGEYVPPNLAYFVDIARKIETMKADELGDGSIATGSAEKVVEILKRAEAAGIDEAS